MFCSCIDPLPLFFAVVTSTATNGHEQVCVWMCVLVLGVCRGAELLGMGSLWEGAARLHYTAAVAPSLLSAACQARCCSTRLQTLAVNCL